MIVTSNKPFSAWGEIFGDDIVAAAMIDRLVHHAEILSLKGDSYRLRGQGPRRPHRRQEPPKSPDRSPSAPSPRRRRRRLQRLADERQRAETSPDRARQRRASGYELRSALRAFAPLAAASHPDLHAGWSTFQPAQVVHFSTGLDKRCSGRDRARDAETELNADGDP